MCTSLTLAFFLLYEIGLTLFYKWVRKESAEMTTWVILGSKVLKLLFAAGILILVKVFTHEPIVRFALILAGILFLSIIFETAYFLLSIKENLKK